MEMVGIIFSNIYDDTMGELTKHRTIASLPFGGRYRQVDFALSNMVNSKMSSVGIITKYNYQSLMDHLGSCNEWDMNRKNGGVFILPPYGTGQTGIYRGKLEALLGASTFLERVTDDYVVMSDTTVLCNVDFEDVLKTHIDSGADVTIVANKEKSDEDQGFVIKANKKGIVTEVAINSPAKGSMLTGMGMFIMERHMLIKVIKESVAHGLYHLERDFLQRRFMSGDLRLAVHEFNGVVLRNKNISQYLKNNMKLLDEKTRNDIFKNDRPIYTKVRDEVPTQYGKNAEVKDCLIADGCIIKGTVENSIIFRDVTVEEGAIVKNCMLMQGTYIGKNADISYTITDKNVYITKSRTLMGADTAPLIIAKEERV